MIAQCFVYRVLHILTWVVGLQLFSELIYKLLSTPQLMHVRLIDSTTLADGTYELVPESESEQREAQVNLIEITEDLNQSSEEPKASSAQEGKPRSISYLI